MQVSSGYQLPHCLKWKATPAPHALISEGTNPVRVRRSGLTTAFSSRDDPMQFADVLRQVDGTQERLATEEPVPAGNIQQGQDAPVSEVLVLDRRSQPDMRGPFGPGRQSPGQMRPFGEQEPVEIRRALDERPKSRPESVEGRVPLEHVRHGCAEHTRPPSRARRFLVPAVRLVPVVVAELPPRNIGAPHIVASTLGPGFRVAVGARRRDLGATPPRVERMARPFDR